MDINAKHIALRYKMIVAQAQLFGPFVKERRKSQTNAEGGKVNIVVLSRTVCALSVRGVPSTSKSMRALLWVRPSQPNLLGRGCESEDGHMHSNNLPPFCEHRSPANTEYIAASSRHCRVPKLWKPELARAAES
jgi:hypothetical protein